jgi:hypothetical protein
VAAFCSPEWLDEINARLRRVPAPPASPTPTVLRVVFEFPDAPAAAVRAMTFTADAGGAHLEAGDHLLADCVVRLTHADASRLAAGELDGGRALREGRLKVRGDVNAVIAFGTWIEAARTLTATED